MRNVFWNVGLWRQRRERLSSDGVMSLHVRRTASLGWAMRIEGKDRREVDR